MAPTEMDSAHIKPGEPVLDVRGLKTHFFTPGGAVEAVDRVDL